jgi:hypothetical protein
MSVSKSPLPKGAKDRRPWGSSWRFRTVKYDNPGAFGASFPKGEFLATTGSGYPTLPFLSAILSLYDRLP